MSKEGGVAEVGGKAPQGSECKSCTTYAENAIKQLQKEAERAQIVLPGQSSHKSCAHTSDSQCVCESVQVCVCSVQCAVSR